MTQGNYRIDPERLEAIVDAYSQYEPNVSTENVEATLLAECAAGPPHRVWVDRASPQVIAAWLAATTFDDFEPA